MVGAAGTGKSTWATEKVAELCPGKGGLVIAPTIQLTFSFLRKGYSAETFRTCLKRNHLKYAVGSSRWAHPRWLIVTEVFQLWAHEMDALLGMIELLPTVELVVFDGDPFQHGGVCSGGASTDKRRILSGKKRSGCSRSLGRCGCKPLYSSPRFKALFPLMEKVRLTTNHRLTNRGALTVIDEIQRLGVGACRRSQWKAAIEDFVAARLVKEASVPDDDSVLRIAYSHKTIRQFTERYYRRMGITSWDAELCLHEGCTGTIVVSKRLPGGRYAYYNGQRCRVQSIGPKKLEVVPEDGYDDGATDEARAAALLETGASELKTIKLPRRDKLTGEITVLPDFIETSYKVQGKTNHGRIVVYLDGSLCAAALYVMMTRGDDVSFVCNNPRAFFTALYSSSSDFPVHILDFYGKMVTAAATTQVP